MSGMILEVQIQIFRVRQWKRIKVFIFKKFPRGPNINIFLWKLAWSFLYNKEQMQKYKFEIWLFKSIVLDPQKSAFLVFKENPPK